MPRRSSSTGLRSSSASWPGTSWAAMNCCWTRSTPMYGPSAPGCARRVARARIRSASSGAPVTRRAGPVSVNLEPRIGEAEMSVTTQIVNPVPNEWDDTAAAGARTTLEQVVFASHLLGGNRALANFGGGNTSAKGTAVDHVGREVAAIWVKGSGSDLATMSDRDFTPLRLDEVLPLFELDEMPDEAMVAHLARCQIDPAAPRSSIETLLHAFIPAAHVHHTHPDAINVLACSRDGRALISECFGEAAAWVDYIRPGFTLAKQVGAAVRDNPDLGLVVLGKHGLVVWGDTAKQAYERTVAVCGQTADFVNAKVAGAVRFGGANRSARLDTDQ